MTTQAVHVYRNLFMILKRQNGCRSNYVYSTLHVKATDNIFNIIMHYHDKNEFGNV